MTSRIQKRKLSRIAVTLIALLCGAVNLVAQVDAGAVLGTVKDASGAIIPGVKITLTNDDTGAAQVATSGSNGEYIFAPVKIGTYSLAAEFKGFKRVEHPHVSVEVQQRVAVNFVLPPGEMTQTVTVSTEVPLLQTEDASVGQVIRCEGDQ